MFSILFFFIASRIKMYKFKDVAVKIVLLQIHNDGSKRYFSGWSIRCILRADYDGIANNNHQPNIQYP